MFYRNDCNSVQAYFGEAFGFLFARVAQAMHFTLAERCGFVYAPAIERQNDLITLGHFLYYFRRSLTHNYTVIVNTSEIVE